MNELSSILLIHYPTCICPVGYFLSTLHLLMYHPLYPTTCKRDLWKTFKYLFFFSLILADYSWNSTDQISDSDDFSLAQSWKTKQTEAKSKMVFFVWEKKPKIAHDHIYIVVLMLYLLRIYVYMYVYDAPLVCFVCLRLTFFTPSYVTHLPLFSCFFQQNDDTFWFWVAGH